VLLILAVPRTIAALVGLGADHALYEISWARTPERNDVVAGIAALSEAVEWVPSSARFVQLASLELELAWSLPADDPRRMTTARDAERHLTEGLVLNPANGIAWLRLASTRELLGAPARAIASCVVQSLDMAPNFRGVWLPRARFVLLFWPAMTVEEKLAARHQLRTIWNAHEVYHKSLVQLARETGALAFLQWSLGDEGSAQAEFRKLTQH
jgi:hypothetical protein